MTRLSFMRPGAAGSLSALRVRIAHSFTDQPAYPTGGQRAMRAVPPVLMSSVDPHPFTEAPAEPSRHTRSQSAMNSLNPSMMSPIAVSRHTDYLAEAERDRMIRLARAGQPRRNIVDNVRQEIGTAMIGIGQRVAGRPVNPIPAMPGISSLR